MQLNDENGDPLYKWDYHGGSVVLTDVMGSDLTVVNSARVSFGGKSKVLTERDKKLIKYLASHKHMSPFRHVQIQLCFTGIPEVVARQHLKHQVGCAYTSTEFRESATIWNEISGRYVELPIEFFTPKAFRTQSKDNKQGSLPDVLVEHQEQALSIYQKAMDASGEAYKALLALGVCKEQARFVLPMAFKTSYYWTGSLEAFVNFVRLRKHPGAQWEMVELAEIVDWVIRLVAPVSAEALLSQNSA